MSDAPLSLPCQCGRMAIVAEGMQDDYRTLRIACACGLKGASLWYRKPEDRARTLLAASDGWTISNGGAFTPLETLLS